MVTPANEFFWLDTDNRIVIYGLALDDGTGYINNATITAALYDASGDVVTNASSISFAYISGSNGNYEGIIPYNAAMTEDSQYTLVISVVGTTYQLKIKIIRRAQYKGAGHT